ncbi:MAG TPA: universal stress protein [Terracidiphilus sp.]|nr:universal stress protein [Terracidiphilus sp.]
MPESAGRWSHPSVILVATDLSDLDRLIPFALKEAAETESRLLLIHVLSAGAALAVDAAGMPYYDPSSAADYSAKTLEAWRTIAHEKGIACDILIRDGNPAQQIAAAARQFNAGRVLLGTRSRGKVSKLLLGSVAEQVLRSVNLPVMTVGPEAHLPVQSSLTPRVVLHATTLREASRPSAALACQIAIAQNARLVLLHVLPTPANGKDVAAGLEAAAKTELAALAEFTGSNEMGCPACIEPRVVHGNPAIEILATASELDASLIVLGATQRSALQNLTRDRTIYRVLAHARCPVLTLREAATAIPEPPETASLLHF